MGTKMISIDTNVIARFLTRDDEQQYQKAYRIFKDAEEIFITTKVILETEWVLRFSYRFSAEQINQALLGIVNLKNVRVDNKAQIISALQWHQQGMDFADALHLAGSSHADKFASFDKKFRNKANALKTGVILIEP
jgi:predicted nucleic-acid-binding protein